MNHICFTICRVNNYDISKMIYIPQEHMLLEDQKLGSGIQLWNRRFKMENILEIECL